MVDINDMTDEEDERNFACSVVLEQVLALVVCYFYIGETYATY